jgi:cytochrome c peroxidase
MILQRATRQLESIKSQYPYITYADLYTLAGATAIEAMNGPYIAWRAGRQDESSGARSPANGRMPDATKVATK